MAERNRGFPYISSSSSSCVNEFEAAAAPVKQGIVTILASDCENTRASSLRRTLSADMSSKNWLARNGFFSSVRKIASYDESVSVNDSSSSSSSSSSDDEENYWTTVLSPKEKKQEQGDVWGSILAPKNYGSVDRLPVYVHPLEKKSSSCMSDQSLQMCTECIGSETGSDGFCSEIAGDDLDEEDVVKETKRSESIEDFYVSKLPKKASALVFPPPLSSISGGDGSSVSVQMQSHRKNGRLILEAIPVPSRTRLHAHRQNGRLQLTLINPQNLEERSSEKGFHTAETVAKDKIPVNHGSTETPFLSRKSSLMMSLTNRQINSTENETTEEEPSPILQSLPPPQSPLVARKIPSLPPPTASSFNPYEYFRRSKTAVSGYLSPNLPSPHKNQQDLVLLTRRNKTEYSVPYLKGCKEYRRRSLLIWEPYCIATS